MVRYLADASLHHAIVAGCARREPAIDFLSAHAAKLRAIDDPDVLAIAAEQGRILVTHDFRTMPKHFAEFLAATGSSPGVFLVKQRTRLAEVIDELVLVWTASEPEDWSNRIVEIPLR
jgi:predicted nuclease of predicted toxin-antitoxin system